MSVWGLAETLAPPATPVALEAPATLAAPGTLAAQETPAITELEVREALEATAALRATPATRGTPAIRVITALAATPGQPGVTPVQVVAEVPLVTWAVPRPEAPEETRLVLRGQRGQAAAAEEAGATLTAVRGVRAVKTA